MGTVIRNYQYFQRFLFFHRRYLAATSSAAPDIDSDTGRPRELVLSFPGIAIPIVLLFYISNSTTSENILAATLIPFFLTRYLLEHLLAKFTVHRGLRHSVPAAVLCSDITYLLFFDLPVKYSITNKKIKAACRRVSTAGALLIRNTILTPGGRKLHKRMK